VDKIDTLNIVLIVAAVVFAALNAVSFKAGVSYRKKVAEAEFGSAEEKAKKIVEDAQKSAKAKAREVMLEAKEENHKLRSVLDAEIKDRRRELSIQENRVNQKEENLDKKSEALEKKEHSLNQKMKEYETKSAELDEIKQKQVEELEKISGLSRQEAKELLISGLEQEARHEAAVMVKEIEQEAKETAVCPDGNE
jgi:ribonuclease Y